MYPSSHPRPPKQKIMNECNCIIECIKLFFLYNSKFYFYDFRFTKSSVFSQWKTNLWHMLCHLCVFCANKCLCVWPVRGLLMFVIFTMSLCRLTVKNLLLLFTIYLDFTKQMNWKQAWTHYRLIPAFVCCIFYILFYSKAELRGNNIMVALAVFLLPVACWYVTYPSTFCSTNARPDWRRLLDSGCHFHSFHHEHLKSAARSNKSTVVGWGCFATQRKFYWTINARDIA